MEFGDRCRIIASAPEANAVIRSIARGLRIVALKLRQRRNHRVRQNRRRRKNKTIDLCVGFQSQLALCQDEHTRAERGPLSPTRKPRARGNAFPFTYSRLTSKVRSPSLRALSPPALSPRKNRAGRGSGFTSTPPASGIPTVASSRLIGRAST